MTLGRRKCRLNTLLVDPREPLDRVGRLRSVIVMIEAIAKTSAAFASVRSVAAAVVRRFINLPEALIDAIEKEALRK
jgi:hypothetical protein